MKKLNHRKLKHIHNIVSRYDRENNNIIYDIPSLMKYCIENDVKALLKEEVRNIQEDHINNIFSSMNLEIKLKQPRTKKNSVIVKLSYKDIDSFLNNYRAK